MAKDNNKNNENKVKEPEHVFKTIHIFDSFKEENEFTAKQRASLTHQECLEQVEELRQHVFHQYLLPSGYWPSISKTFEIVEPNAHETGQ